MRVFIAVSCLLAVASAGYYGGQYQGPLHIPVLDHNGVPVEPKEVQEARRNHLAALSGVQPAPAHNYGYAAPQQHYQPQYNTPQHQYQQPQQQHQPLPVIDAQGVPQDAPDVAAAKAAHFAAYAEVNARAAPAGGQNYGYAAPQQHYQPQYNAPQQYYQPQYNAPQQHYQPQQPQHVPVIDAQGIPQDTPEVAAAKAAHFAAHAQVAQPQHHHQW